MAFGNKKKTNTSNKGSSKGGSGKGDFKGEKGNWKKILQILESEKYSKTYANADGFHGALLFLSKDDKKLYRVKNCSFASREDLEDKGMTIPNFVVGNISMNLNSAEEIDLEKIESLEEIFEDSED